MEALTRITVRDLAERTLWTGVSAGLAAVGSAAIFDIEAWQAAAAAAATAVSNAVLVIARWRLRALPDPGAGLPGLPVDG